ncbi:MAG TPA: hypothetical protein IAA57_00085 [Candidatus Pullilachnospira intestinigallinarum]|nr:hypothetical protein [Candidatus Pullilachnospira intestinigallinarum]
MKQEKKTNFSLLRTAACHFCHLGQPVCRKQNRAGGSFPDISSFLSLSPGAAAVIPALATGKKPSENSPG